MMRTNHEVLQRAIALQRAESPACHEQLKAVLAKDGSEEVALLAASSCQHRTLDFKPWQPPPMEIELSAPPEAAAGLEPDQLPALAPVTGTLQASWMPPFMLTDDQWHTVIKACALLDPSQRATLWERISSHLRHNGARHPSDTDVEHAVKAALTGLLHGSAA